MTTKRSHTCEKEEILSKINHILLGPNGDPKKGLSYMVFQMADDVTEIKTKLSSVTEINTELEISRRVALAIEETKEKVKIDQNMTEGKSHTKKALSLQTIMMVVGILSFCVITLFTILNYFKSDSVKTEVKTVNKKIDNFGEPVIISKDGKPIDTRSFEIKMYPKDFDEKDSIK